MVKAERAVVRTLSSEVFVFVSKRTEFVMLKTSKRTSSPCARGLSNSSPNPCRSRSSPGRGSCCGFQLLRDMAKRIGVRRSRNVGCIVYPGHHGTWIGKAYGAPPIMNTPELTGPVCTMLLSKRKFWVKPRESIALNGNPLVQRVKPDSCQPPIMASSQVPEPPAKSLSLPERQFVNPVSGYHMA